MKARHRFEAWGRSCRSRGFSWGLAKCSVGLYALPKFAQRAFARGYMHQSFSRGVPHQRAA